MNRVWRLHRYPEAEDFASALSLEEAPMPAVPAGSVLLHNHVLSLDAGTRMWMSPRTDGYQPPIALGNIMPGLVLSRIIESKHPGFVKGSLVRAFGHWSDYSSLIPEQTALTVLDETLPDIRQHLGVLGMNGWTAYVGITEAGRARPGENVLVSAAAGATGMLAAQIAKIMGCRVIGMTGGDAKRRFLLEELRLDGAIDYRAGRVGEVLAKIPGGIHLYFDNVGGPLLDEVLPNMAHYGRVAVCGLVATYAAGAPAPGPARFDQVLMRRLSINGFFSPDFAHRGPEINALMRPWLEAGRIAMKFDVTRGLDNVLKAYGKLFNGGNVGKVLVEISDV